ncbi:MAG: pyruvoyl-dependent arginine decarboxylase [Patescibacteria group bacterium]|nr:pyruvoyl-dependent arginine decarboxylase [Patescibacteria group bacterium]
MNQKSKRTIYITSGIGNGQTKLSAFDAALWNAGIANFNLIRLSSIIPPYSQIKIQNLKDNGANNFGDKLYVVLACKRESEKGREAWAGVGWVQTKDGRGLFVEHEGAQQAEVIRLIKESLTDMVEYRKEKFGEIHYQIVGIRCENKPVCAVVAAVYKNEGWD